MDTQEATIVLSDAISAFKEYCFTASGNILNPGKTSPAKNSFQLTLQTSDNYFIDQTLTGVFATPYLSAGPFKSAKIESIGAIVGGEATVRAELVLKSELPTGSSFFIQMPASVFYVPESGSSAI